MPDKIERGGRGVSTPLIDAEFDVSARRASRRNYGRARVVNIFADIDSDLVSLDAVRSVPEMRQVLQRIIERQRDLIRAVSALAKE